MFYSVSTITPHILLRSITSPATRRTGIRRYAPNRLLNIKKVKAIVDKNLTLCQVCKSDGHELCNGESMGLEINIVVRCREYDKFGTNLERSLKYLTNKINDAIYEQIYDKDQRQKIRNKV